MVVQGDEAQVEAQFNPLEIVVILLQDDCMVCTEHTRGSKTILYAPDGTTR
jgi:hypothetical protein